MREINGDLNKNEKKKIIKKENENTYILSMKSKSNDDVNKVIIRVQ